MHLHIKYMIAQPEKVEKKKSSINEKKQKKKTSKSTKTYLRRERINVKEILNFKIHCLWLKSQFFDLSQ